MPTITLLTLTLSILPCIGVIWIAHKWADGGFELIYATARMVIQLLIIGFALVYIFESDNPLIGIAIIVVMIVISALISIRVVKKNRTAALFRAIIALGIGGGLVLAFILFGVLRLQDPLYQPRLIIPIAGMIFSNAMTAITLAAERFNSERSDGQPYESSRKIAWTAAMIPQINALLAVGLVSLPGMMTGQILSGVDPLIAVRYQIVVMAMVLQASGYSVALFLWLSRPDQAD